MNASSTTALATVLALGAMATAQAPEFTGPVPYQTIADSPFFGGGQQCPFALETFPGGDVSVGGWQIGGGTENRASIVAGVGVPPGGFVLQANDLGVIQLDFQPDGQGAYPNEVGFVWTGGSSIGTTMTVQAIAGTQTVSNQYELPANDPDDPADNSFFGVTWSQGIEIVRITLLPFAGGVANQIDDIQFQSASQPLLAPVPASPASGEAVGTSPTFQWASNPCATWYRLWVNDSTGNRLVQWYTAEEVGASSGICSVTPDLVLNNGGATWWVLAWNAEQGSGPWSAGTSFTVGEPLTAPVTIEPSGTISGPTPTYRWQPVAAATWYQVWVNDSTGNRLVQWYTAEEVGAASGECSITPDVQLAMGDATWWVRAWNVGQGNGPWSAATTFTVGDSLTAPVTIAPAGTIAETMPTYRWEPVATATWYQLWIDDSSGDRLVEWFTAAEVGAASGECSITPNFTLTTGNGTWWVRAWNADQGSGPWSAGSDFTVE